MSGMPRGAGSINGAQTDGMFCKVEPPQRTAPGRAQDKKTADKETPRALLFNTPVITESMELE